MEYVTLNNGVQMPMVGFGVFEIPAEQTAQCVFNALETGYRLIDTAQAYYNEKEVGDGIQRAMKELGIRRADIFITTKVWVTEFGYEKTKASIEESLRRLQTDYLDLVLIHQCLSDYYGAYRALEELYDEGKSKPSAFPILVRSAWQILQPLTALFQPLIRWKHICSGSNMTCTSGCRSMASSTKHGGHLHSTG